MTDVKYYFLGITIFLTVVYVSAFITDYVKNNHDYNLKMAAIVKDQTCNFSEFE
jgi:hypothetical protein